MKATHSQRKRKQTAAKQRFFICLVFHTSGCAAAGGRGCLPVASSPCAKLPHFSSRSVLIPGLCDGSESLNLWKTHRLLDQRDRRCVSSVTCSLESAAGPTLCLQQCFPKWFIKSSSGIRLLKLQSLIIRTCLLVASCCNTVKVDWLTWKRQIFNLQYPTLSLYIYSWLHLMCSYYLNSLIFFFFTFIFLFS